MDIVLSGFQTLEEMHVSKHVYFNWKHQSNPNFTKAQPCSSDLYCMGMVANLRTQICPSVMLQVLSQYFCRLSQKPGCRQGLSRDWTMWTFRVGPTLLLSIIPSRSTEHTLQWLPQITPVSQIVTQEGGVCPKVIPLWTERTKIPIHGFRILLPCHPITPPITPIPWRCSISLLIIYSSECI